MRSFIEIEARPTFRDWKGRFARTTEVLLSSRRDMVRNMGRKYVKAAKAEAPRDTGKFADSIGYQTYQGAKELGFRGFAAMPLHAFITEGTKPHPIRGNPLLAFMWEGGPQGSGMHFYHFVQHPGTKANPYHLRAWKKVEGEIEKEMRRISTRMFKTLKGETR